MLYKSMTFPCKKVNLAFFIKRYLFLDLLLGAPDGNCALIWVNERMLTSLQSSANDYTTFTCQHAFFNDKFLGQFFYIHPARHRTDLNTSSAGLLF